MKNTDFVSMANKAAKECKTLYIKGCFGAPMTPPNKRRYSNNNNYNKKRSDLINAVTSDTFGFDCICFIKGILWGWNGDKTKQYGGAIYCSNQVPDFSVENLMKHCYEVSSDFSKISVGEVVYMADHAGIYIGNGLVIECSPAWKNKVQITAVKNVKENPNYNSRTWQKHGKLKYIDYMNNVDNNSNEITYIVVKGDTLSEIAKKHNTTYQKLAEYNNISNPNLIKVNQIIKIPLNENIKKDIYYEVKSKDTLSSIAKKFNTTWQKIYKDNKEIVGLNPNLIKPGQKLVIR